ncbi:MAG: replication factor C small subunit [Sylvanvirus sp.]|uniref:Replication factor C small subunit n=1 Tax=Sylvanvirus sp. TaxID=2487774 RepID=A0A3G5AJR4_9VIRU|nr:MAG: replication factor C small subunit [Sylvanvirus sp.]
MWSEKYRPKKIDQLYFNHEGIKETLWGVLTMSSANPHLRFSGPAGCGKTSTIESLVHEWYPHLDDRKTMILELNASHDKGIDVIRNKVIPFMEQNIKPKHANPLYSFSKKVVILDEADSLTPDAQTALRRPMETCASHTMVVLLYNYASRIICPILSRAAPCILHPLCSAQIQQCLNSILAHEHIEIPEPQQVPFWTWFLPECADGDLRNAINKLQIVATSGAYEQGRFMLNTLPDLISIEQDVRMLMKSKDIQAMSHLAEKWSNAGLSGQAWCHQLLHWLFTSPDCYSFSPHHVACCISAISQAEYTLSHGADIDAVLGSVLLIFLFPLVE